MSDTQSIYKSALGLSETTCPSISKYVWTIITKYLALGCPVPIQDTSHHHPNDVKTFDLLPPSSSSTLGHRDDYSEWVKPGLSEYLA